MPSLNLVILTPDAERFRGALTIAAASAALGENVAIFLQLDAVRLLNGAGPRDVEHCSAGLPSLTALIDDAQALGVRILACQTGLSVAEMDATTLRAGVEVSGAVAFLSAAKQGRLILV